MATVWLPFGFGYFLSYGLRNVNAVLAPELTREFALSAAQLGLLTSVYYVAFALVQLPSGVLLDRFGPRRVHASLMLVAAAGCALHAFGHSYAQLAIGRALIGVGLAVALMSAVKAFTQWFPATRVPLAINLVLGCGGIGAMVAAGPVGWALDYVSWRVVFVVCIALLLAGSSVLYLVMPDRGEKGAGDSWTQLTAGFLTIFANATFWRMSLMMAAVSGTYSAVQSLWIGPWLRDVGGLARDQAVLMMTWFAVASILGFAIIGSFCDRLIRRGASPLTLYKIQSGVGILLFGLTVFAGGALAMALWIAYFMVGSGGALVLAALAREFPAHLSGRVNTANNVLMFSVAFAFQWGIGAVLDLWPVIEGRYAPSGYRVAFGVLLGTQLAAYALLVIAEHPVRGAGPSRRAQT
jgi:MFS family permease